MIELEQIKEISKPTPSRIVLLVIDGLGGLPHPETGKTELESADTPNLNQLATEGICGMIDHPGQCPWPSRSLWIRSPAIHCRSWYCGGSGHRSRA